MTMRHSNTRNNDYRSNFGRASPSFHVGPRMLVVYGIPLVHARLQC